MLRRANLQIFLRRYSQSTQGSSKIPPGTSATQGSSQKPIDANVPGLSNRVIKSASGPVGPGASATGEYKVPEYFCFDKTSYYEAEIELAKYRLPQPSANSSN